jgi:hypothetical protein
VLGAPPRLRERPGSPRLGGDHAENFGNVIDPKCGCHTHGSAHNLRRAESWRANSSPGARETCGGARGRALNARSAKLDLHFSIKDLSQGGAHTLVNRLSLIVGGYQNGRALPIRENLQEICKEIHDGLEVGLKPGISSAAKHLRPHVAAV